MPSPEKTVVMPTTRSLCPNRPRPMKALPSPKTNSCAIVGFALINYGMPPSLAYVACDRPEKGLARQYPDVHLPVVLSSNMLHTAGIQLITKLKRKMKQCLMPLNDRLLLRKRSISETIDQLKNISQIDHSRHQPAVNCFVNILGSLIAYCHQPKKPSIATNHNLLLPA